MMLHTESSSTSTPWIPKLAVGLTLILGPSSVFDRCPRLDSPKAIRDTSNFTSRAGYCGWTCSTMESEAVTDLYSIAEFLDTNGAKADSWKLTGDDSILLDYYSQFSGCVDIYPSGEINVIINDNGEDCVYEFMGSELLEIAKLLKNAASGVV